MLTIHASPKELAELMVAIRDGEFGSDPAEQYFSREDTRAQVNGAILEEALDERDEAFALAAVHSLTLEELSGKTPEELRALLESRAMHIIRPLSDRTTGELIAELKRREEVRVIKVDAEYPYQIVAGGDYKTDIGPAMILVINGTAPALEQQERQKVDAGDNKATLDLGIVGDLVIGGLLAGQTAGSPVCTQGTQTHRP